MIQASYAGEVEYNNTKGILLKLAFTKFYGVNGVGDLLNLAPYESEQNPNGILDPKLAYNTIIGEPPEKIGVFNEDLGGYYIQLTPNANPTLVNLGVRVFAPGGAELNTNQAYPAAMLNGSATLEVFLPLQ
jgi:hypothetical protein